ncbi:hypothetical protein [Robiginitalea sp. IMCC43444]|uniref:hypothetical protein n=1 Tax=Robiginitalea sp. IMCC43444 TaxID=3459121 RepID=UPI0040435AD2
MKKASVLFAAAALLFSGSVWATNPATINPKVKISEEIHELLHKNDIQIGDNEELYAWVRITVNSENEIVVLSVNTENEAIESLVKNRLNYHKLGNSSLEEGKTYRVAIRFTS